MSDLLSLADRVAGLSEADREVDALIACYIGKPLGNVDHWLHGADITYRPTAHGFYVAVIPEEGNPDGRTSEAFKSPAYTASLDAALSLVPEGYSFLVGSGDQLGPPWAWVGTDPEHVKGESAATPALALCAASLRARSASVSGGSEG
jgi:hypothetical protein